MSFETAMLLAPLLAVAVGLFLYWWTDWMDRREQRRHHPAE
jgi:hypothetical protein